MDVCITGQPPTSLQQLTPPAVTTNAAVDTQGSPLPSSAHQHTHSDPLDLAHQHAPPTPPSTVHQHTLLTTTLSPPSHGDLEEYKVQLEHQVEVYWERLSRMAWGSLSPQARVRARNAIPRGCPPSYRRNRALLLGALSEAGWPRPQRDFVLVEDQISQAQSYLDWCKTVTNKEGGPSMSSKHPHTTTAHITRTAPRSHSSLDATKVPSGYLSHEATLRLKGQVVVARSDHDGLYYPSESKGASPLLLLLCLLQSQHIS